MSYDQLRANDIAQQPLSSSWLTSLPLKSEGYDLNKREFFDALALRYRWPIRRLPTHCSCGKPFDVDHAMTCLKGGFIHRRHDDLRDLLAKSLKEVFSETATEPRLQPLTGEQFAASSNTSPDARLDIAVRGFWQRGEMAFFDVRVFNPR